MMRCQAMRALRKYSSQAEPEVLDALQAIADREGRQLQVSSGMRCGTTWAQATATASQCARGFPEKQRAR